MGFTGLKGAGVSELMQTIFGVMPETGGVCKVMGKSVAGNRIHNTKFGRSVYAIGSNERAARLAGINVEWTQVAV